MLVVLGIININGVTRKGVKMKTDLPDAIESVEDTKKRLEALIECNAQYITTPKFPCDKVSILKTIAVCESSFGVMNHSRFEPAYFTGGFYYEKSEVVRDLVEKFGKSAACSYSSFQILFVTACELGFHGTPEELGNDDIAIFWVMKFINKRIIHKNPEKIEDIFDAYNSGSFRDKNVPLGYVSKAMYFYSLYCSNGKI